MIVKPIGDFKNIRKSLPPDVQVQVDNLVLSVFNMAQHLCELKPQYQKILINLGADNFLTFIISRQTQVEIYAYLEQPDNDIMQQTGPSGR